MLRGSEPGQRLVREAPCVRHIYFYCREPTLAVVDDVAAGAVDVRNVLVVSRIAGVAVDDIEAGVAPVAVDIEGCRLEAELTAEVVGACAAADAKVAASWQSQYQCAASWSAFEHTSTNTGRIHGDLRGNGIATCLNGTVPKSKLIIGLPTEARLRIGCTS